MNLSVLDTDILTEVYKRRNRVVARHAVAYLRAHSQFAFSAMTRFEMVRGIRHKKSSRLMQEFSVLEQQSLIYPISNEVLDRAADLWVEARHRGKPHRDADLIIAATALLHGRNLVTGNTPHFDWIGGLYLANWREP
jgi:predicted nucleic acid-binding protein